MDGNAAGKTQLSGSAPPSRPQATVGSPEGQCPSGGGPGAEAVTSKRAAEIHHIPQPYPILTDGPAVIFYKNPASLCEYENPHL